MSQHQHELEEHPQQQQQQQSDISSLQESFSKQQKKISALKELVRKSEVAHGKSTSSAQEKVKNIAQRLTNLKSKARSRQNLESSTTSLNESHFQSQENLNLLQSQCSTTTDAGGGGMQTPQRQLSTSSARIETPGSEKILLLRKQMEENKVKMAEREHSKREIEHMVTQLKAKFDTTQQCLEHSSELGRSMGDLSALSYSSVGSKVRSATDLASAPFNLDKERIKFLDNRVRLLEKQLEKEKTSSDASKRVKELENKILELEESLQEKRTRDLVATLNDHDVEESWQIENDRLKTELEEKSKRIIHLEEVNDILETAKCDLTERTQELEAKLREYETKSKQLEEELEKVKSSDKFEVLAADDSDLDRQVEQELLKQVHQLESRIKDLHIENEDLRQENENLQEANKEDRDENDDSLEARVESQQEDIMNHIERNRKLEEELMEKTIELNVLNANFAVLEEKLKVPNRKPLFATTMTDDEISSIKDELTATKKTAKHLEKQLHDFKRMSDLHATVAELTDENEELQQRITELEDEKGQLLLKLESGEHTTVVTEIEIEKKIEYLEATCQNQTSAIQLLEEQKIDMTENLETTKSELESARVVSEMESIQLEEQVNANRQRIEELQRENFELTKTVEELRSEKNSLGKKVEHYVAENMELLDKIEKLSKSSSSAESIEIVERLTQQDRLEIEAFNKHVEQEEEAARQMIAGITTPVQQPMDPELTDSLLKLKEESSELMHKIELFTTERKEVLEKMEAITAENQEHLRKIDRLSVEKQELEKSNEEVNQQREALQKKFDDANVEKESIRREIREVSAEKTKITAELNNMIKAASVSAPSDGKDLLDKCEKSLAKLNTELESYRKTNDRNAKLNVSKKLSKEAKNAHQQLTELLQKIKSAPVAEVSPSIADELKINELQAEISDLREQLTSATAASEEKDSQISRLNTEMASLRSMSEQFDKLINDKEMAHEKQLEHLTRLRRELEAKLETSEAEMKILQDLIAEQKQQLIEAYTENESELGKKIEELNARDEEVVKLKLELDTMKANSGHVGQQFSSDLQMEVDKLREALSINKSLLAEQIDDLTNKQETIETLNAQIMELYKTMEENAEKVIEKEDEIALLQEQLTANKDKIEQLTKENEEQNKVVDKLLLELHSQKSHLEKLTQLPILENDIAKLREENQTLEENLQISELKSSQLEKTAQSLEQKNKEQLDKLKKLAANLKKKVTQCQEFEAKIKNLEKGALDAEAQEKNPLIDELKNEVQDKTAQLELKSQEIQALQEATNQQRLHFENCVLKVQQALDGVQNEMTSLREQLHEKVKQVDELTAEMNQSRLSQPNLQAMQQQIWEYHNQINERNAKIDELNDIIECAEPYQEELQALREQLNQTNTKISELNMINIELQRQLSEARQGQVTGNVSVLQEEIRNLQNQLNEKNAKIDELNDIIHEAEPYHEELPRLREELRNLHNLCNEKNAKIDELNDIIHEAEPYHDELARLREELNEKNTAIKELNELNLVLQLNQHTDSQNASLQDELRNLQNLLNEKNAKIDALNDQIQESQPVAESETLRNLHNELNEKNAKIDELNDIILEAEPYHEELHVLREQLNEKNTAIDELNAQLTELTILREKLNAKEKEIENQNKILDSTEEQLNTLQEELDAKTKQIQQLNNELNSNQVSAGQPSEEIKLKDAKIEELTKEFKAKSLKFEKSKAVIKEKNKEIQRLNQLLSKEVEEGNITATRAPEVHSSPPTTNKFPAELEELRKENTKLREEAATERASFQETIARLETVHDGIQAKLQEDMNYIESLEQENNNFKEKICRLEECVAMFEERRSSMERRANLLDAQLQTRTDEHAKVEDELVYRLNMLSDHDDIIGQRLFEAQEENDVLSNRLETLKTEHSTLLATYGKLEKEYSAFKDHTKINLEAENQALKTQVATIDAELNRVRGVLEAQLAAKNSEIDELENELSEQLRLINDEKRHLTEELEKTKDEVGELKDERVRLNETLNSLEQAKSDLERESTWIKMQNENLSQDQFELQELRMQTMQDKTELENLKHQIETLVQNHDIELNALRTQISELDSMRMQVGQNQTDDQVFIETENKRLTDLLAEKESLIENYQRQNLQLQMNALAARQQPVDPFANLTQSDDSAQLASLREKCDRLERELNEKQREIDHLRMEQHHQQQVMVPPPMAFFGTDQSMPSVFDEIAAPRHVDNLHGAGPSRALMGPSFADDEPVGNQQTIEDLQRNVSDLEKHAQDLENKLAHRIAAHEDSLRQLDEIKRTFEIRMREYEERIRDLERRQDTSTIEAQIMTQEQLQPPPPPSLNMFFQSAPENSPFENLIIPQVSTEPVVEETIVPKRAYDCRPAAAAEELELDEGWGWGSAEAALEAKHFASTSNASLLPPQQQMELKLQEHQERIQELELERDRLVQQKQDMQVKSGKLMKKLKEYKTKIDELYSQSSFRKSSSVESSDLDLAIQEEMKSQLKQLEEKLAEAKKLTDAQSLEKENLLKRIDVLTAGNERLAEMKERQDNDVAMYKSRLRELTEKIKSLEEWSGPPTGTSEATPAPTEIPLVPTHELEKSNKLLEKKVEELLSEIEDISGDRTELQALLDEEKANLQRAEQTVKSLNEKITRLENSAGSESADMKFQFNEIKLENQNLKSQLTDLQALTAKEKRQHLEEIKQFEKQSEVLSREIAKVRSESANSSELAAKLKQVSDEKHNLIQEIEALRMELTFTPKPSSAADEFEKQISRLTCDLDSVVMQNQDLGREVDRLRAAAQLQQAFNVPVEDNQSEIIQSLKQENERLTSEINRIQLESSLNVTKSNFAETEKLSSEINRLSTELQTALSKNEELSKEIAQLRLELSEKTALQSEINRLVNENQSLTTQIGRSKLESSSSVQLNELEEQIQEKDSEIMHLKQRIEDLMREDQTEKLVLEILTKNQEIHLLKMQVKNLEDDKHELDHNLTMQITQEMTAKRAGDNSAEKIQQLQQELEAMRIEKGHMEEELQVLNNHVMTSLENEEKTKSIILELDAKNIEIAELRKSLSSMGVEQKPVQSDAQWEAVIEQRCSEIADMWRAHLENREKEFKDIENKLQQEIEALKVNGRPLEKSPSPSSSSKETTPDLDLIQKMQEALESQEVEIVTLKEQLAIRSAEYARLAAQFDPYKMQSTMSHSSGYSSDGQRPTSTAAAVSSSQAAKSELDLALYMLHQRDMRCEELTLELVHLLEERDTLQLKLSNTLRQVEAIKSQCGSEPSQGELSSPNESPEKPQVQPAGSPTPESDELHQKLSQLQSVSHSKRFQEERDMRQRQMEQFQQDIAKMPSEALSEIVGSDYSQSNQSPSSVLLNWLWGKPSGGGQS